MSRDFSHGYGPEEYLIRSVCPGRYFFYLKLFNSLSKVTGTTVLVRVWTCYANPLMECEKVYCVRLHEDKEVHPVGCIVVGDACS